MKIKDSDQTKYWWTADLHFKHRNIVEFTNRGVDTTQEDHDEWLINLWNSQVGKNDVVFHLGDFVFNCRKLDVLQSYLNRLNGKIILIRGNHDDKQTLNQSGLEWYDIKGVSLNNGGEKSKYVVMCHYPMRVWDKSAHGSWMLHGHSHGSLMDVGGKILDVGLDNAYNIFGEHKFFTTEDLSKYMDTRDVTFNDHHGTHTKQ